MHVLVIGAGVAGPVLATALRRVGIDATVFERDPIGAEERGAWLTFQANGMDALAAIDADAAVRGLGFEVETITAPRARGANRQTRCALGELEGSRIRRAGDSRSDTADRLPPRRPRRWSVDDVVAGPPHRFRRAL